MGEKEVTFFVTSIFTRNFFCVFDNRSKVFYSQCLYFFPRLADLAMEFELEKPPTIDDMLMVIINREDVEALIGRPVRYYLITVIQHNA